MAERRRRKCADLASDESGDETAVNNQSEGSDGGNSEYESVDGDEIEEEEEELIVPNDLAEDPDKPLDDDEDRKNPQYIPKKGTFYEHDDRNTEEMDEIPRDPKTSDEAKEENETKPEQQKKKVWREDDKWTHDRFLACDQTPKSREELVATYGYDIRNEEGPPRARRRRRYGRGPNKYTRNWEDFDAYSKPARGREGGVTPVGGRGGRRRPESINSEDEFPSLPLKNPEAKHRNKSETFNNSTHLTSDNLEPLKPSNPAHHVPNENVKMVNSPRQNYEDSRRFESHRGGKSFPRRGTAPRGGSHKGPMRSHNNVNESQNNNRSMDRRGGGRGNRGNMGHPVQDRAKDVAEITEELKSITITPSHAKDEHHYSKGKRGADHRRAIPPRMQDATHRGNKSPPQSDPTSKPKRYSSQRQRTAQDQVVYQQQSGSFYEQTVSEPAPPSFIPPSFSTPSGSFPPEPFLGRPPGPRMAPLVTQPHLIGPAGPIAPTPVPVPGGPAVAAPSPVSGPPFIPPDNMINFAAGAPTLVAAPHPNPQFSAAAFQAFTPVSQAPVPPQEIYSNGTMYYNTQSQQHLPRINPSLHKRPKAAIPIVPPPDNAEGHLYEEHDPNYSDYPQEDYQDGDYPQDGEYYEEDENYDDSQEYQQEEGMQGNEQYHSSELKADTSPKDDGEVELNQTPPEPKSEPLLEEVYIKEEPVINEQLSDLNQASQLQKAQEEDNQKDQQLSSTEQIISTEQEKILIPNNHVQEETPLEKGPEDIQNESSEKAKIENVEVCDNTEVAPIPELKVACAPESIVTCSEVPEAAKQELELKQELNIKQDSETNNLPESPSVVVGCNETNDLNKNILPNSCPTTTTAVVEEPKIVPNAS